MRSPRTLIPTFLLLATCLLLVACSSSESESTPSPDAIPSLNSTSTLTPGQVFDQLIQPEAEAYTAARDSLEFLPTIIDTFESGLFGVTADAALLARGHGALLSYLSRAKGLLATLRSITPPPECERVNQLFIESIGIDIEWAETWEVFIIQLQDQQTVNDEALSRVEVLNDQRDSLLDQVLSERETTCV